MCLCHAVSLRTPLVAYKDFIFYYATTYYFSACVLICVYYSLCLAQYYFHRPRGKSNCLNLFFLHHISSYTTHLQSLSKLLSLHCSGSSISVTLPQDEVHERDRFCDFLLIKLKRLVYSRSSPRHPKFKLVLMSAALDAELFVPFGTCTVKTYEVAALCENIWLFWSGFTEKAFYHCLNYRKK